jgi:regulator of replication initiation timing
MVKGDKSDNAAKVSENGDILAKMLEMFEKFTGVIVEQMKQNAQVHSEMMSCELFDIKTRLDNLEKENLKLRQENEELKKRQGMLEGKMEKSEVALDDQEQMKLKNDVIVTGNFEVENSSASMANFLKKTCDVNINPASITKVATTKNKMGQNMVRMTIVNSAERIALLKSKKTLLKKKIYVSEALTNQKFQLLMASKAMCKSKYIFSAWSKEGRIFVKKTEDGIPLVVKDKTQLDSLAK